MFVDQRIDTLALVLRAVAQIEQAADFFECHVQAAAIADKGQPFDMGLGVQTVIAVTAGRLWQQLFALVITDGFDLTVGQFCQLTNFHQSCLPKVT